MKYWIAGVALVILVSWFVVLPWFRKRKADKAAGKP